MESTQGCQVVPSVALLCVVVNPGASKSVAESKSALPDGSPCVNRIATVPAPSRTPRSVSATSAPGCGAGSSESAAIAARPAPSTSSGTVVESVVPSRMKIAPIWSAPGASTALNVADARPPATGTTTVCTPSAPSKVSKASPDAPGALASTRIVSPGSYRLRSSVTETSALLP